MKSYSQAAIKPQSSMILTSTVEIFSAVYVKSVFEQQST